MKLPLTNIEKFTKCTWDDKTINYYVDDVVVDTEMKGHIVEELIGSGDSSGEHIVSDTFHYSYNNSNREGIFIIWDGNPFDLDFYDDNYVLFKENR